MAWQAKGGKPSAAPPAAFGGKRSLPTFKGAIPSNGKGPGPFREPEGKDHNAPRGSFKGQPGPPKGGFRREPIAAAAPPGKGLLGSKGSVFTRTDGLKGHGAPSPVPVGLQKGFNRPPPGTREGYGAAMGPPRPMGLKGPGPMDRFDAKGGKGGKKGPEPFGFKGGAPGRPGPGIQAAQPPMQAKGGDKGKRPRMSPPQRLQSGEQLHAGIVRSFNPDKKNGFIDCPSMPEYGSSVYVFQDVLERALPCRAGPGDRVAFFVHWSPKGQPQASSPLIKLRSGLEDGQFALKGTFKSGKEGGAGFGFVECKETKEFFGRDVYVNKDLAQGLETGMFVCFNAYLNRDGMPNAEGLEICDESWEPLEADLTEASEVETGKGGKGSAKGFEGKGKGKMPGKASGEHPQPHATGRFASGLIKSFNPANNYGFIESAEIKAEFHCDVFMHGKEFSESGVQVGDTVFFEVATNVRGQPQAINISLDGAAPEPPAKRARTEPMPSDGGYDSYDPEVPMDYEAPPELEDIPPEADGYDNFSFSEMLNANDGSYE